MQSWEMNEDDIVHWRKQINLNWGKILNYLRLLLENLSRSVDKRIKCRIIGRRRQVYCLIKRITRSLSSCVLDRREWVVKVKQHHRESKQHKKRDESSQRLQSSMHGLINLKFVFHFFIRYFYSHNKMQSNKRKMLEKFSILVNIQHSTFSLL